MNHKSRFLALFLSCAVALTTISAPTTVAAEEVQTETIETSVLESEIPEITVSAETESQQNEAPEDTETQQNTASETEAPAEQTETAEHQTETVSETEGESQEQSETAETETETAEETESENAQKTITGIIAPEESILKQEVKQGAEESEICFPETLQATVTDADGEKEESLFVEWKLSNAEAFSSEEADAVFTYIAKLSEKYEISENVKLPEITVTIKEATEAFDQSTIIDNIKITVKADEGVFPKDSSLKAVKIDGSAKEELKDAVEEIKNPDSNSQIEEEILEALEDADLPGDLAGNTDAPKEEFHAFDITILDKDGQEIQPDNSKGQVSVSFSNPNPGEFDTSEYSVYHQDEASGAIEELPSSTNSQNMVEAKATSFSPYMLSVFTGNTQLNVIELTGKEKELTKSGIYYVAENAQLKYTGANATSAGAAGGNGLKIASGVTAYIYIPATSSITATGGRGCDATPGGNAIEGTFSWDTGYSSSLWNNSHRVVFDTREKVGEIGKSSTGGGAGILVPQSSNLVIIGNGKINAAGGNGGNAGKGGNGGKSHYAATADFIYKNGTGAQSYYTLDGQSKTISVTGVKYIGKKTKGAYCFVQRAMGTGGAGGAGASGGGAALGTNGGTGSNGTNGAKSTNYYGVAYAADAEAGKTADSAGTIHIADTITTQLTAGNGGTDAGSGANQSKDKKTSSYVMLEADGTKDTCTASFYYGQPGAGGAAGGKGAVIGKGGQGGTGGQGGSSGALARADYVKSETLSGTPKAGASGSKGSDSEGSSSTLEDAKYPYNTVTFTGASNNATQKYYLDKADSVTAPKYNAPSGKLFKGWKVTTPAEKFPVGVQGTELIKEGQIYQADEVISTQGIYGEVVLTPVLENLYKITVTTEGNGQASASVTEAVKGTAVTLTATPDAGYDLKEWQINGTTVTDASHTFTMPAKDVTAKAVFVQSHTHSWSYTADGNTITATCTAGGSCRYAGQNLTFTLDAKDKVFDGAAYDGVSTKNDTTAEPSEVRFYAEGELKNKISAPVNAGTYYAAVTLGEQTAVDAFTITKKQIAIPAEDKTSYTYSGNEQTYALASGNDYEVQNNTRTDAGDQTVTVSLKDKANTEWTDETSENKTYTFHIEKAASTLTADEVTGKTYGDDPFSLNVSNSGNGELTYKSSNENVVIVDKNGRVTIKNSGEAKITVASAESGNYKSGSADVTIKIAPKKITVKAVDASKTYGATDPKLEYSAEGQLVGNDTLADIKVERESGEDAKTYAIKASEEKKGANKNYSITFVDGTFTITAKEVTLQDADITIEANETGFVYDGQAKEPSVIVKDGENVIPATEYTVSYENNVTASKDTKDAEKKPVVKITNKAGGNYVVNGSKTFEIAKADPELSVSAVSDKTYGDEAFKLEVKNNGESTPTFASDNKGVAAVDETGKVTLNGAGKATITVSMAESENYNAKSVPVEITVKKQDATLTVSKMAYEVAYGDPDFKIGEISGNGESKVTFQSKDEKVATVDETGTVSVKNVGETTITLAKDASANYNAVSTNVTVKVVPKKITVTAKDASKIYGSSDPKLEYSAEGQLVGNDTLSDIKVERESGEDAKTYVIKASEEKEGANKNYSITFVDGTFTITAKEVTLQDADITIETDETGFVYDGQAKEPTVIVKDGENVIPATEYTVSYENNVTASKDTKEADKKPVVKITNKAGGNYVVNGSKTFEIAKADPELSVSAVSDKTYGDEAFKLEVKNNGESTPTFTSDNKGVAAVDETGKVTLNGAGKATITVSMAESENYNAKSVPVEITVNKKDASLKVAQMAYEVTYGDADFNISGFTTEGESGVAFTNSDDTVVTVDENGKVSINNVGEAEITLSMTESANYKPVSEKVTVKVVPKDITGATVELDGTLTYTGKEQKQNVKSVVIDGLQATFDVTENQATKAGEYVLKITGNGNFTGTIEQKFTVEKIPGNVTFEVNADQSAPHTEIGNNEQEMIAMLASEEELEAIEAGDTLKIWVEITDASATVSGASKKLIQNAASDYQVGAYIDISLFKKLATAERATQITGTNKPITVSVTIPENLRNSDPKVKRSFMIVRVHDGVAEILPTTVNGNTLTFTTDKFSDYAIMYKDEKPSDGNHNGSSNGNPNGNSNGTSNGSSNGTTTGTNGATSTASSPKTGDESDLMRWWMLMMLGLSGMAGSAVYRRKSRKTK